LFSSTTVDTLFVLSLTCVYIGVRSRTHTHTHTYTQKHVEENISFFQFCERA